MPQTIAALADQTSLLLTTVSGMHPGMVGGPSLLPGWTRGHVLTHLARNADGIRRLLGVALDGVPGTMYPSEQARDQEIEAGAGRDLKTLAMDVGASAGRVADALDRYRPALAGIEVERTPGGARFPVGQVPAMRLREVVIHHVDLDAGFGWPDVSTKIASLLLQASTERLRTATPQALRLVLSDTDDHLEVPGPGHPTEVTGRASELLAWLTRGVTDGLRADGELPSLPKGL